MSPMGSPSGSTGLQQAASGIEDADLLAASAEELAPLARAVRKAHHGERVTFSPKVFIPLTMLCRDRCGYCTFAKPPARAEQVYLDPEQVLDIASKGALAGCHEALFTLGERPELRFSAAREWLASHGYATTIDYLAAMAALVLTETGLLPHLNAGALYEEELAALRPVSVSQGMMLESLDPTLACHRGSPDKAPERRLATLEAAGRLKVPFTTGLLVGIGDDRATRLSGLRAIAASHRAHGHVQEVLVQGFLPKSDTAMHSAPPCSLAELTWTIAAARLVLQPEIHVQSPPNLVDDLSVLLDAGADDLGGVSPLTLDHVNPERAWPQLAALEAAVEEAGSVLAPRLAIHPAWALQPDTWLDERVRFSVLDRSDAEGLARDAPWVAGGEEPPPLLVDGTTRSGGTPSAGRPSAGRPSAGRPSAGRIGEILEAARKGELPGEDEIVALFGARGSQVGLVAEAADELRATAVGDTVTFVFNRNINYTNVCTFKCRFCAFSKGPLSLNLRGAPYLLELEEVTRRVVEAEAVGATEVCLQGGIHPSFDGDYYLEVIKAVRAGSSRIHIHAFTALEVTEGARRLDEPLETYLQRLYDAGLRTLPGTAAEVLDDEIRAVLCPDKLGTEEWLEAHRVAHRVGLRSNVTIMFGSVEQPRHWARHLIRTRELQAETGGFTEFVPLPFVHMATPLYLQRRSRRGPTFREVLLMHAVGRIAYHGLIDNIQASWVKTGLEGLVQLLRAGCNDVGGTLMDENISRAAGASHGQMMTPEAFRAAIEPLGRPVEQRTTLYGRPGVYA